MHSLLWMHKNDFTGHIFFSVAATKVMYKHSKDTRELYWFCSFKRKKLTGGALYMHNRNWVGAPQTACAANRLPAMGLEKHPRALCRLPVC